MSRLNMTYTASDEMQFIASGVCEVTMRVIAADDVIATIEPFMEPFAGATLGRLDGVMLGVLDPVNLGDF